MKISLPITQVLQASSLSNLQRRSSQQSLKPFLTSHCMRPLEHWPSTVIGGPTNFVHTTNFFMGTPPQMFRAFLDFGSSDLVVPSGALPESCKSNCPNLYNSSKSRTYRPNGTQIDSNLLGQNSSGFLSEDDFHISDLSIQGLLFEESPTMRLYEHCFGCDMLFDTILPLGPYNASNPRNFMSPLAQLIEKDLLGENIFSLRLSRGPTDGDGELVLGGMPDKDLYDSPTDHFITIPVTDIPIPDIEGIQKSYMTGDKWKSDISSISLGNGSSIRMVFKPSSIAIFDSTLPWMIVPHELAESLNSFMDAETWGPFAWVNCSKRVGWPNITIEMAGRSFVLTPYDYTMEQVYPDEPKTLYCMSAFLPGFEGDEGLVLMGSAFLKAWVSVWDLEGRRMSFVRAKHGPPRDCADCY